MQIPMVRYLFRSDGRLALIDFGCVKRFSLPFIRDYSILGNSILDDDQVSLIRVARDMGMLVSEDPESAAALWDFAQGVKEGPFDRRPFLCGGPSDTLVKDVRRPEATIVASRYEATPGYYLSTSISMGTYSMLCRFGHQAN